jgi:hypothetical protein
VIALLRYAYLKGLRDSSLIAFILVPMRWSESPSGKAARSIPCT